MVSMLLTSRQAVGLSGWLDLPPVSEPARISQKSERPEPLWPPKGKMAPGGRGVECLRIRRRSAGAVDDEARLQRLAPVAGDLDLPFGDKRGRDVEDQRRLAGDRRARGDRVCRQPPVAAAMRRDQDAEARRVDEMNRHQPPAGKLLGPSPDAAEMAGIANGGAAHAVLPCPLGCERP